MDDSLMFVFDGPRLESELIAHLQPDDDELSRYAFLAPDDVRLRLRPYVWNRLDAALKAAESNTVAYLHNGHPA
ncbi:hypothetical protein E0H75_42615 [Kribbella capetownensis]|uniref:Uncharacterized protein n=1 Tax=Kribbella capetownensis TaxID=1572659 RepID=A0A4R0IIY3_9ACTN|nr:hypothetical protein [Kribbella capetownensis]TCC32637.1 hypothetical protein E0H75_42615 [Kribbella capetownensis]